MLSHSTYEPINLHSIPNLKFVPHPLTYLPKIKDIAQKALCIPLLTFSNFQNCQFAPTIPTSQVKLLGAWPSPFVWRVQMALDTKSIDYEFLEDAMLGVKSELLLKSNPVYKKIPVLIHNEKPICESLIILHYIDEVWTNGPSILPPDPYNRAIARFWALYIDNKWFPALRETVEAESEEARKAATRNVGEGLGFLEDAFVQCSKGKAFFGGDHIGYLDMSLGCFLGWLRASEKMNNFTLLDKAEMPALFEWAERFSSDGAMKNVVPEINKLIEFAREVLLAAGPRAPPPN